MISKELLTNVLSINVIGFRVDKNTLRYFIFDGDSQKEYAINIYELAHKCKEWANNKGYVIFSSVQLTGLEVFIQTDQDGIIASFEGIEQEAIFKACEWILKN